MLKADLEGLYFWLSAKCSLKNVIFSEPNAYSDLI